MALQCLSSNSTTGWCVFSFSSRCGGIRLLFFFTYSCDIFFSLQDVCLISVPCQINQSLGSLMVQRLPGPAEVRYVLVTLRNVVRHDPEDGLTHRLECIQDMKYPHIVSMLRNEIWYMQTRDMNYLNSNMSTYANSLCSLPRL